GTEDFPQGTRCGQAPAAEDTQDTQQGTRTILPRELDPGHSTLVPVPVLCPMDAGGGHPLETATAILDRDLDGLEQRTDLTRSFRGGSRSGEGAVSQMDVGKNLHGLVRCTSRMARATGTGGGGAPAEADAAAGRKTLAAGGMVRLCRGRLACGMPADYRQRGVGLRWAPENRAAVVSDDPVAHGHGFALGFSHRSGNGK